VRICIVTTSFPRYAGDWTERTIPRLARYLVHKGFSVQVVAPFAPGYPCREVFDGVTVHRFVYTWPKDAGRVAYGPGVPTNLAQHRRARWQLPAFMAAGVAKVFNVSRGADLIHAFWVPCALMAIPASQLRRIPIVLSTLGSDLRLLPRCLNRLAFRATSAVTHATAELGAHLDHQGYTGPRFEIRNVPDRRHLQDDRPLEPALARWCAEASGVVALIARLVPFKDPLGFIRAVPHVLREHPEARFLVVGDGPLREPAQQLVRDLHLEHAVKLTGPREDVGALLRASTVFVANSPVTNCFSATIQEALYAGVPAVVTDVGDPTGSFRRRDYVELCRPSDPADLARAINRLLADPALRRHRSQLGRAFLQDLGFTEEETHRRLMVAYETALRLGPAPH